jgi:hypothetical protein
MRESLALDKDPTKLEAAFQELGVHHVILTHQ